MKPAIRIIHDNNATLPDAGVSYLHCKRCITELPHGESPESYARQQVGLTSEGHIQVRCTRHNLNIDVMKVELNT